MDAKKSYILYAVRLMVDDPEAPPVFTGISMAPEVILRGYRQPAPEIPVRPIQENILNPAIKIAFYFSDSTTLVI